MGMVDPAFKIGRWKMEVDWLKKTWGRAPGEAKLCALIDARCTSWLFYGSWHTAV